MPATTLTAQDIDPRLEFHVALEMQRASRAYRPLERAGIDGVPTPVIVNVIYVSTKPKIPIILGDVLKVLGYDLKFDAAEAPANSAAIFRLYQSPVSCSDWPRQNQSAGSGVSGSSGSGAEDFPGLMLTGWTSQISSQYSRMVRSEEK
jgi:hypothetical protein